MLPEYKIPLAVEVECFELSLVTSNVEPVHALLGSVDVELSINFGVDESDADTAAAPRVGGLFLSNGLIRSDGFNVFDWNLL